MSAQSRPATHRKRPGVQGARDHDPGPDEPDGSRLDPRRDDLPPRLARSGPAHRRRAPGRVRGRPRRARLTVQGTSGARRHREKVRGNVKIRATKPLTCGGTRERVTGIEPAWPAWKAALELASWRLTCGFGCPLMTAVRLGGPLSSGSSGTPVARGPPQSRLSSRRRGRPVLRAPTGPLIPHLPRKGETRGER